MSINMTSGFEFETDDINSLLSVLNTIGKVLYDKKKILFVDDISKTYFRDGSGYEDKDNHIVYGNMVLRSERIYGGATVYTEDRVFHDIDDAAKHASSFWKSTEPTRQFVFCISTNYSNYTSEDGRRFRSFSTAESFLNDYVKGYIENLNESEFFAKFGSGYNYGFNHNDGSVGLGYRLHWEPSGAEDKLYFSLVHAYYGK